MEQEDTPHAAQKQQERNRSVHPPHKERAPLQEDGNGDTAPPSLPSRAPDTSLENDPLIEHRQLVAIPQERLPVLLGRLGAVKKAIEQKTGCRLRAREAVEITGPVEGVFLATNIVRAIGRGFDPVDAFQLADEEMELEVISLGRESRNTKLRLFGRIIGRNGQVRKNIESACTCRIAVYGKTVSLIAHTRDIRRAAHAVELLLEGHKHAYVYKRIGERELL